MTGSDSLYFKLAASLVYPDSISGPGGIRTHDLQLARSEDRGFGLIETAALSRLSYGPRTDPERKDS